MPISAIDELNEDHWQDVKSFIFSAIENAGFEPDMVSNRDDVGVIQATIIQSLYNDSMVVVDCSKRNPNVMFELGVRIAFNKPFVIIKDDLTPYSFDTGPIEHLAYPRDLRYPKMVKFGEDLTAKIKATAEQENWSILHHFGPMEVANLDPSQVQLKEYFDRRFDTLVRTIDRFTTSPPPSRFVGKSVPSGQESEFNRRSKSATRSVFLRVLKSHIRAIAEAAPDQPSSDLRKYLRSAIANDSKIEEIMQTGSISPEIVETYISEETARRV